MKTRILIIFLLVTTLFSCKKEGYMYQATFYQHEAHPKGVNHNLTTFFEYPDHDDQGASDWYKNTDHYKRVILESDSFEVKYFCTSAEWGK